MTATLLSTALLVLMLVALAFGWAGHKAFGWSLWTVCILAETVLDLVGHRGVGAIAVDLLGVAVGVPISWHAIRQARTPNLSKHDPGAVLLHFDSWPGGPDGPFLEAETEDGRGVQLGTWIGHDDGTWALRVTAADVTWALAHARDEHPAEAAQ